MPKHDELDPDIKQAIIASFAPPMERNRTKCNKVRLPDLPSLPEETTDGLTPQKRIAVGHLVCGESITATAIALGISRTTIYRWMQEPEFARVVDQQSREALDATTTRARNLLLKATRELELVFDEGRCFNSALRMVNSARLWAMANVAPKEAANAGKEPASAVTPDPAPG